MKKFIVMSIATLLFVLSGFLLYICSDDTKNCKIEGYQTIVQEDEDSIDLVSIKEAREELNSVMKEAEGGKYSNLSFDNVKVNMTDENEIYTIDIARSSLYDNNYNIEEDFNNSVQAMSNTLKKSLNKELNMANVRYVTRNQENNRMEFSSYNEDFLNDVRNGKYKGDRLSTVVYKENKIYMAIVLNASMIWFDTQKATCYGYNSNHLNAHIGGIIGIKEDDHFYKYEKNDKNNKEYNMIDGSKLSIVNAINYVENYYNNHELAVFDDYRMEVYDCFAIEEEKYNTEKNKEMKYGFFLRLRKVYKGIPMDVLWANYSLEDTISERDVDYERAYCTLVGEDNVDLFLAYSTYEKEIKQTGEVITEILPLSAAMDIVSKEVATEVSYTVKAVELIYRCRVYDRQAPSVHYAIPYWKLETINDKDDRYTRFYVNVVTGELEKKILE